MTTLGPFDIGNQPVITAEVDTKGVAAVSTAVTFTVTDPLGGVTVTSSPDADIANPEPNVWTLQMPVLAGYGKYLVVCDSTAGVNSSKRATLTCKPL